MAFENELKPLEESSGRSSMNSLKRRKRSSEGCSGDQTSSQFYAVYIPLVTGATDTTKFIHQNLKDALSSIRRYPGAVFKKFSSLTEALVFSKFGPDRFVKTCRQPSTRPSRDTLKRLEKAIERGHNTLVRELIDENPRCLVTGENTPVILVKNLRHNALHLAARTKNAEVAHYVLERLSNVEFIQRIYGNQFSAEQLIATCERLTDMYLNTPDTRQNLTPLHFAAKNGDMETVTVLVSHPLCEKRALNVYGRTPYDMITLARGMHIHNRLRELLTDYYYVPVLGSDFLPESEIGEPIMLRSFVEVSGPPGLIMKAWAGPMDEMSAKLFKRLWKASPQRDTIIQRSKLYDTDKGLEVIGRRLATNMNVRWVEYWPFLDTFIDLRTPAGLQLLNNYLRDNFQRVALSPMSFFRILDVHTRVCEKWIAPLLKPWKLVTTSRTALSIEFILKKVSFSLTARVKYAQQKIFSSSVLSKRFISNSKKFKSVVAMMRLSIFKMMERKIAYFDKRKPNLSSPQRVRFRVFHTKKDFNFLLKVLRDQRLLLDVFLLNTYPTRIDADILQVLEDVFIDKWAFPFITHWMKLCTTYAQKVKKEKWEKPTKLKRKDYSREYSPSWNQSRIIRAHI